MNNRNSANRPDRSRNLLLAAGGYLLFVVYGSLVPLDFTPRSPETMWRDFLATPYLALGVGSRADWVANILLYVPLAYLLTAGLALPRRSPIARALLAVAVFVACATLAIGIEFTQLAFPPRTVSLNDIIAELIGSALGIAACGIWGGSLARLLTDMKRGGMTAIRAMLAVYLLGYLLLSLFPYDFFVSAEEFSKKFDSRSYGWLVAPMACGRVPICLGKLALEIIAAVPLGLLLSVAIGKTARRAYALAMWTGLALGLSIEVAQLFIASGVSQGVSLLTRAAGAMLGVGLHRTARGQWLPALQPYATAALLLACLPYLLGLMWVSGWFRATWGGLAQASAAMEQMHWLPFYYHYFTTETRAVVSLMACVAMYFPVGIGYWLFRYGSHRRDERGSMMMPAIIAAALAGIIEAGKLFAPGQHPDPTNILIGASAAAAGYRLVQRLSEWTPIEGQPGPRRAATSIAEPASPSAGRSRTRVPGAMVLMLAAGLALGHPLPGPWLLFALAAYSFVAWRLPWVGLPVVIASLPLLNFTPTTGSLMLDEFDLVVLVTLGVTLCRPAATSGRGVWSAPFAVIAGLVATSYLVSMCIGLLPLQPWDANAFSNYYSHYNSLRVAKGALWAFSLLWLAAVAMQSGADIRRLFTLGMVAGLAGTVAVIVWERIAFTGLFNFSHDYRVSGPFSALHVGGSSLEAYLVAALPFALFAIMATRNPVLRLGGLLLFGGGVYGIMVAYSRAGFAALAAVAALMVVAFLRHGLRRKLNRIAYAALSILFVAGLAVVATPMLKDSFAQERLAQSERDLQTRFSYWRNALAIMDDGWRASLFGMGLGRFPETYFWRSTVGARPGTYVFERENGNTFLRLGSGSPIFVDQIVALQPHGKYTLSLNARQHNGEPGGQLGAPICEVWTRGALQCEWLRIRLNDAVDTWQSHEIVFNSKDLGARPWYARGPVRLNLGNLSVNGTLDVDNVRLVGEDGRDLLRNGGFDHGGERWLITVNDNWPWHIENFWLHIFFEQGWLGLLGMAALIAGALTVAITRMWRGDLFAGTLLAAIAGFLVVGVLNSPNDNPQLVFLFLSLCWLAYGVPDIVSAPSRSSSKQSGSAFPAAAVPGLAKAPPRFDELDSLRALAAIAVVLVHYRIHFDVHPLPVLANLWADGGDLAVDFFFVLSGFVLCRAYWTDSRRFRIFANLWERVARLYPLQLLTLLLVAWGQWYLVTVLATRPFVYNLNDGYHFLLNAALLNASGLEKGFSFNAPSWSVSTEFIVNALFLLLIMLPRRLAMALVVALAVAALVLLFGAGEILTNNRVPLAAIPHIGTIDAALVRTSLGFFLGVLLWSAIASSIGREDPRGSRRADLAFLFAGLCIAALFGSYRIRQAIPHWDFVLVLILFPIIVASATASRTIRAILRWSPLLLLGHASYSIYLLHFPLQLGLHIFAKSTGLALPYDEWWFLVAFLLLTFACAVAAHKWIELPAKRGLRALAK